MIVDSHVHVVASDHDRFPLDPPGFGSQWYRDHPVTVEEFERACARAGVERAVLVQAVGAYGYDNSYVVEAGARPGFVSVVAADMESVVASDIIAMAATRSFGGIRVFAIDAFVPLDEPSADSVWQACADLGRPVVVAALPPDLAALERMLERHSEISVLLDHVGFPDLSDGPPFEAARQHLALARHENLHVKVTSMNLEQVRDAAARASLMSTLVEAFGAARVVWGSDYPQTHDRAYPDLVELASAACSRLGERDRSLVLGGNASRLWPALAEGSIGSGA